MLIIGDLSGIQDYLFDVRESGGKQAVSLRSRSFRLQVIAECLARRFLWACGLDENRLLFVAAGKFAIDADGVAYAPAVISQAHADSQQWLFEHAHGRLRLAIGTEPAGSPVVDRYTAAMAALQRSKLSAWRPADMQATTWTPTTLSLTRPWDNHDEAERDADEGRQILTAAMVSLAPAGNRPRSDGFYGSDVAGVVPSLLRRADAPSSGVAIDLQQLSRHIPRDQSGAPVEFIPLAARSRGAAMLGVLKADADSLGEAIRAGLSGAADLVPLRSFSKKLEGFFGPQLDRMMSAPGSPWADLYTVFSGGDDILLVGPWSLVIDFAAQVRRAFSQFFALEKLTISAGVALVKPRFPIRLAAAAAEELLEDAKTHAAPGAATPKDQFAALGGCWKWSEHDRVIGAGKRLADWVNAGTIERGWLHTLLELVLLQRSTLEPVPAGSASRTDSSGTARSERFIPAMAGSRLAYHVARNWPKHGPARQWVDAVRGHFDRFPDTTDPITIHLPSAIRYALLATRSPSDKE